MDAIIKNICEALQQEAEVIKSYTDLVTLAADGDSLRTFEINRMDAVEHIQNMTLELTKYVQKSCSNTIGQTEED